MWRHTPHRNRWTVTYHWMTNCSFSFGSFEIFSFGASITSKITSGKIFFGSLKISMKSNIFWKFQRFECWIKNSINRRGTIEPRARHFHMLHTISKHLSWRINASVYNGKVASCWRQRLLLHFSLSVQSASFSRSPHNARVPFSIVQNSTTQLDNEPKNWSFCIQTRRERIFLPNNEPSIASDWNSWNSVTRRWHVWIVRENGINVIPEAREIVLKFCYSLREKKLNFLKMVQSP